MAKKSKPELYVVFKGSVRVDAAYCNDINDADRFIRGAERKHGVSAIRYLWGKAAEKALPNGFKARTYRPRVSAMDVEFAKYKAMA